MGQALCSGCDALGEFSCRVSCTLLSREPEQPAGAEAGRWPAEGAVQTAVPPSSWVNPALPEDSAKRMDLGPLS